MKFIRVGSKLVRVEENPRHYKYRVGDRLQLYYSARGWSEDAGTVVARAEWMWPGINDMESPYYVVRYSRRVHSGARATSNVVVSEKHVRRART